MILTKYPGKFLPLHFFFFCNEVHRIMWNYFSVESNDFLLGKV